MFGVSYPFNGQVYTYRGFDDLSYVYNQISNHVGNLSNVPIVFHFRIATSGKVNTANSHPFVISSNFLQNSITANYFVSKHSTLCHNGVLANMGNKYYSDTCHLTYILSKIAHPDRIALLDNMSGYSNKFAVTSVSGVRMFGNFTIHSGIYFSNMSWQPIETRTVYTGTSGVVWNNGKWTKYSEYDKDTKQEWYKDTTSKYEYDSLGDYWNQNYCGICNHRLTIKESSMPLMRTRESLPVCDECTQRQTDKHKSKHKK